MPGGLNIDGSLPARSATAVWQLPVTMEAVDADLGRWTDTHLAGVAGGRPAGFTDVYDVELPAQVPARLAVSYDRFQYSKVEVWDWSASSWSANTWADDPNDPARSITSLGPTQVAAGLLRLRVREVRISWGAGLSVSTG